MIGRKDMKQETMAKRTRNKAVANKMMAPRKKMDMGMAPGPDMGPASAPMMPMGMKKGGKVDFSKIVQDKKTGNLSEKKSSVMGTGPTPSAAKADYAKKMAVGGYSKGGMAKKGMKGGGMMLVIGLGKKKGK
jgi:hypothetical protein